MFFNVFSPESFGSPFGEFWGLFLNEVLACPLNLIRFPSIFAIELEQAELLLKEAKLALEARSLALIALYIASFISSLIFGPILGRLADQYGRKRLSLIA